MKEVLGRPKNLRAWAERQQEYLERECPRLSDRERGAEAAEREAVSWKKCQFMADKVGEAHWGFVTGVAASASSWSSSTTSWTASCTCRA